MSCISFALHGTDRIFTAWSDVFFRPQYVLKMALSLEAGSDLCRVKASTRPRRLLSKFVNSLDVGIRTSGEPATP